MNFSGFWYNKSRAGEGINVEEHSDGRVFAVFFTLGGGAQKYFPCDGQRTGTVALLKAYSVTGEPGSATEEHVGTILLDLRNGVLIMSVEIPSVADTPYTLQRWYTVGSVPTPEPEPEPEPEPPPIVIPAGLKLETKSRGQTTPRERVLPYEGGSTPIKSEDVAGSLAWNEYKFTNTGSEPVLIKPSKMVGPNNPKISGLTASGKTLQPGDSVTAVMSIGPLTVTKPGSSVRSEYGLHLANGARIAGCTVQVEYPN